MEIQGFQRGPMAMKLIFKSEKLVPNVLVENVVEDAVLSLTPIA